MIEKIPFFKNLNPADIKNIEQISVFKKYNKGEIFFLEGEKPVNLSILIKGRLKIYKTSPKGKEIFIHDIRPINFIAEVVNFENISYPASSIFMSNSEILSINYAEFKELFQENTTIILELLKSISSKLKIMDTAFTKEIIWDSEGKVANFICENFEAFSILKYSQIAKILNLTPETFSRIITKFKKLGLLVTDSNGKIIDFNKKDLSEYFII